MLPVFKGDTVRVSLTEDPEFELVPCSTLIRFHIHCLAAFLTIRLTTLVLYPLCHSSSVISAISNRGFLFTFFFFSSSLWYYYYCCSSHSFLDPILLYDSLYPSIGAEMLTDDSKYAAIPEWTETTRDFMNFSKRKGDLPVQIEGDIMDIRGFVLYFIASTVLSERLSYSLFFYF